MHRSMNGSLLSLIILTSYYIFYLCFNFPPSLPPPHLPCLFVHSLPHFLVPSFLPSLLLCLSSLYMCFSFPHCFLLSFLSFLPCYHGLIPCVFPLISFYYPGFLYVFSSYFFVASFIFVVILLMHVSLGLTILMSLHQTLDY